MKRTLGFLVVLTLLGAATPYIRDYMTVLGSTTSLPASAPAGAFVYVPDAGPVFFNGAQWVKTSNITNNISAPRGTLSLSSDAGVASGDVAVKVGTSSTSVSGVAWPFQVVSGLGSTDSFIFGIRGTNTLVPPPIVQGGSGWGLYDSGGNKNFITAGPVASTQVMNWVNGTNPAVLSGFYTSDGSITDATSLHEFATGNGTNLLTANAKVAIKKSGQINQRGTDSSAAPGAATIDKPSGISAIASGATTVTITNALIPNPATTKVRIMISWMGDHGAARSWVTQGTGSFTVTLSAAASANTTFAWEVNGLL